MEKMTKEGPLNARDIMTSPVIIVNNGMNISTVRRIMLLNEFSRLPYKKDKKCWVWISAQALVKWKPGEELSQCVHTVEKAITAGAKSGADSNHRTR